MFRSVLLVEGERGGGGQGLSVQGLRMWSSGNVRALEFFGFRVQGEVPRDLCSGFCAHTRRC